MKKKYVGNNAHRLNDEFFIDEIKFAKAWAKINEDGKILSYLLNDPFSNQHMQPLEPKKRDYFVAATVIQWLGSPVGQSFLEEIGFVKKNK